ncbi:MAG: hypothetical protein AAFX87_17155 [Bacteroidota bacterium]
MKRLIVFLLIINCLFINEVFGQSEEPQSKIELFPTIGITWRSPATQFFDFSGVFPEEMNSLYDDERNTQGLALNTGLLIRYNEKFEFEYYPGWRYDVVQREPGVLNSRIRQFIVDHNWNIQYKKKLGVGIGFSIINTGKGYFNDLELHGNQEFRSIQFESFNFFVDIPIKKVIDFEVKVQYVRRDFPANRTLDVTMLNLRVYYRFRFLNGIRRESKGD